MKYDLKGKKNKPDIRAKCEVCWDKHKIPTSIFKYIGEQPDAQGGYVDLYNCVKCDDTKAFRITHQMHYHKSLRDKLK